jgi:hypothetical protein
MFIRWRRYRRTLRGRERGPIYYTCDRMGRKWRHWDYPSTPTDEWVRRAEVVASVRTAAGPRQRCVCYLGAIGEGDERHEGSARRFWRDAAGRLRQARIEGADLAGVVAKLEAAIPPPDDFEPGWDEHWRWPPTDEEIAADAWMDAVLALQDELAAGGADEAEIHAVHMAAYNAWCRGAGIEAAIRAGLAARPAPSPR